MTEPAADGREQQRRRAMLPPDLEARRDAAWEAVRETPGFLTEREAKFLMLAAVAAPVDGAVLEIGSFKGRSTVGLALMAKYYGGGSIVAVDPFTAPSSTDPELTGQRSTFSDFQAGLRRAGVTEVVETHRMFSRQLAPGWSRPLRLLWIDGDHTYEGALEDVRLFKPFLAEGGVLAMHDVLSRFPGATRVFLEQVLQSDDFGPAGYSGTIGWAQYRPRDGGQQMFRRRRKRLARTTGRLLRVLERGHPTGLRALQHRLWRTLTPHGAVDPVGWLADVGVVSQVRTAGPATVGTEPRP